ncbi:hypothetical protein ACIBHY_09510 [Nonomuraea sp. NPDC050547]
MTRWAIGMAPTPRSTDCGMSDLTGKRAGARMASGAMAAVPTGAGHHH